MHADLRICIGTNDLIKYNERKVDNEQATCIYAGNFLKDAEELSKKEKKHRFADLNELTERPIRRAVSVYIKFAPGDRLERDDLIDLTRDFMRGIGYGQQPYLVYEHLDTAQQHMHIVTTNIRQNGDRICERYIEDRFVRPTRKVIQEKYGLSAIAPIDLERHDPREKIQYGKTATRQAISDTLQYIMDNYQYRSLPEFNAILKLYNLRAYDGQPGSKLREFRGLIYQVLNDNGKPRNAPIKASDLPSKPTFNNLEKRFAANLAVTPTDLDNIRVALEKAIGVNPADPDQFADELRRNRIAAVPTFDKHGSLTDLFFVDLAAKTVRTPADLGSSYDAPALQTRLGFIPFLKPEQNKIAQQPQTRQEKPEDKQIPENKQKRGRRL